jgi:hypothetical protein
MDRHGPFPGCLLSRGSSPSDCRGAPFAGAGGGLMDSPGTAPRFDPRWRRFLAPWRPTQPVARAVGPAPLSVGVRLATSSVRPLPQRGVPPRATAGPLRLHGARFRAAAASALCGKHLGASTRATRRPLHNAALRRLGIPIPASRVESTWTSASSPRGHRTCAMGRQRTSDGNGDSHPAPALRPRRPSALCDTGAPRRGPPRRPRPPRRTVSGSLPA